MSESDFRPTDPDDGRASRPDSAAITDPEAPEADAAEQLREVVEEDGAEASEAPFDVDPADAAEQRISVAFDDDEYR